MKILHTADWHLGNTFHGHNRVAEHSHFISFLLDVISERQPDALLITGDIFDSPNPPAVAEEQLYNFLLRATTLAPGLQIVLTAGNHDSAGRIEAPASLLKTHNVYVRGTIHYTEKGEPDYDYYLLPLASRRSGKAECLCMALPFLRACDYPAGMSPEEGHRFFFNELAKARKKNDFKNLPVVVAAHFYAVGASVNETEHSERLVIGGQDCIHADVVGDKASYVALGHIHKAQKVSGSNNAYYAGSPLPLSFSEANYHRSVTWVDLDENGDTEVTLIPYTPLRNLVIIPSNGKKCDIAAAMDEIQSLPNRKKADDGRAWDYVELRIHERQPEPTLLHEVTEALRDKAIHYCRIIRVTGDGETIEPENETAEQTTFSPDALDPLKMARSFFVRRYGEDMPQPLIDRFKKAQSLIADEEQ